MADRIKMDISVNELQALNKKLAEDEQEKEAFLKNPSEYLAKYGIEVPESIGAAAQGAKKRPTHIVLVTVGGGQEIKSR